LLGDPGAVDALGSSEQSEVDSVLDELTRLGLLSDARAAAQLLDSRRPRFGMQRIALELRQKGIDESLINNALCGLRETELAAACNVWKKKFGRFPEDQKEMARQVRFLQSRGFGLDVIMKALRLAEQE
jgi:regulatory protein